VAKEAPATCPLIVSSGIQGTTKRKGKIDGETTATSTTTTKNAPLQQRTDEVKEEDEDLGSPPPPPSKPHPDDAKRILN
jgi:hypothetical protein